MHERTSAVMVISLEGVSFAMGVSREDEESRSSSEEGVFHERCRRALSQERSPSSRPRLDLTHRATAAHARAGGGRAWSMSRRGSSGADTSAARGALPHAAESGLQP